MDTGQKPCQELEYFLRSLDPLHWRVFKAFQQELTYSDVYITQRIVENSDRRQGIEEDSLEKSLGSHYCKKDVW